MSSNTPNLGLLKKDPMVDGNETFNIETMLNENWDKVDLAVGQIQEDLENIDVDIPDASLTQKGIVQLNDTLSSTSKTMAATADALRRVYEEANAGKQLGVEQKANVVAALNSIGVTATTAETWPQLIAKIRAVIRATGNATAADILAGKNASNASGPVTGTMPHLTGTRTATGVAKRADGALAVYPEKGYQKGGSGDGEIEVTTAQLQSVEPNLNTANILSGRPIFGVSGGIPNRSTENTHMPGLESTVWAGDRFFIRPPAGYYNGATWVTAPVPGLTPQNLKLGVNVAGLVGTADYGKKYFNRTYRSSSGTTQFNVDFGFNWHLLFVISDTKNGHATCLLSRTLGTSKYTDGQYPPDIPVLTSTGLTMYLNSAGGTYHVIAYEY